MRNLVAKLAVIALATSAVVAHGAVVTYDTSAPSPGIDGIAVNTGFTTGNNNFYSDKGDTKRPGQTFTTGSNAGGYSLGLVSFQLSTSPNQSYASGGGVVIQIAQISGASYSQVALITANTTEAAPSNGGKYLTFTFSPSDNIPTLLPNTVYGYNLSTANGGQWLGPSVHTSSAYSGGEAYYFNRTTTAIYKNTSPLATNTVNEQNFVVGLQAVPEPASLGLVGMGGLILMRRRVGRTARTSS